MLDPPSPGRRIRRTAVDAPHRRVRIARRSHLALLAELPAPPAAPEPDEVLRCGDLVIDVAAHQAFAGSVAMGLSHLQFVILTELVRRAGRVVPADELAAIAAGIGASNPRTIASAVSRLRQHLGQGPQRPTIAVSRSRGYRLCQPAPASVGTDRSGSPGPP